MLNGRIENEMKISSSINKKLSGCPSYVKGWQNFLEASQVTASSRRDFLRKINNFLEYVNPNISEIQIDEITEEVVLNYLITIKTKKDSGGNIVSTSDSYQQTVFSALNNFFNYLYKRDMIEKNWISEIPRPKNRDLDRINSNRILLNEKDFKNMLKATNETENLPIRIRDLCILKIFMNTGIRETAMVSINIDDIDFNDQTLTVIDKGEKIQKYFLSKSTMESIKEWINYRDIYVKNYGEKAFFLSQLGERISANAVVKLVKKYSKIALGYEISPHKLRSGFCSILYSKNSNIEFVRKAVGHANITTTQRYIVTGSEEKKMASQIMEDIL